MHAGVRMCVNGRRPHLHANDAQGTGSGNRNFPGVQTHIAVLGAGSWGTALAVQLAESGHDTTLWARRPEIAAPIAQSRYNPTYLPSVRIPSTVQVTTDFAAAAAAGRVWVIATPSHVVRSIGARLRAFAVKGQIVVSVAKGIENKTLLTTTQVLGSELGPAISADFIGVLSGPSHAEEVGQGKPTTLVAAAPSRQVAERIQQVFMSRRLRVYVTDDVLGVEIGGSVKNVISIAAGISDGIGYGDNAKAALIARGLAEIQRLGVAMGARAETFMGLAGIGDLVVTCTSRHSRNRYLGEQIGRGFAVQATQDNMQMVAEGVRTTASVRALARRYDIEMPITEAVYAILFEGKKPGDAVQEMMTRSATHETWLHSETPPR